MDSISKPHAISSQPPRPLRSGQLAVERGKWGMSGGAGNLQDHAIGEIATGTAAIEFEGGRDDVALLHDELFLIEQYLDRGRYLRPLEVVHGIQNPGQLHEDEMRNPGASFSDVLSAAATCVLSSRVARRTMTLVSIARMLLSQVLPNAFP